jgi:hypothetical protein
MGSSEKQILFAFYWAATMMSPRSKCFVRIDHPSVNEGLPDGLQGNCTTILDFWQIIKRPHEFSALPPLRILRRN